MNGFNKTEAGFSCRLCFLRAFPIISLMYNIIDKAVLSHDFEIEKNHGLFDKADEDYSLRLFCVRIRNYDVSDHTCAMIPNDQLLYLKQVNDEPHRNSSTVFRVWVRALFEWQNSSKVAFVFAFNLDAFALCINGPSHSWPICLKLTSVFLVVGFILIKKNNKQFLNL